MLLGITMFVAVLFILGECDDTVKLLVYKAAAVFTLLVCGRAWKLVDEFDKKSSTHNIGGNGA